MALQKTSEKKLSEIFNFLMNEGNNDVARMVMEILRAECKVKRGSKFSLYDFVDKNSVYEALTGIYYSNGCKIATDRFQIIVLKEEYNPELEGKIINESGEEVDAKYPKYQQVLPESLEGWTPHEIDPEEFYSWIDERRAAYKLENGGKHVKWSEGWFVRIGHCLFKASRFNNIIKAGKVLGSLTLYTIDAEKVGVIQTEKGCFGTMPWRETDSDDVLILK